MTTEAATTHSGPATRPIRKGTTVAYLGNDSHFGTVGTVGKLLPGGGFDGTDAASVDFCDGSRRRYRKTVRLSMLAPVKGTPADRGRDPEGGNR